MDEDLKALVFEGATARTGAARRRGTAWVGVRVARASWGWDALMEWSTDTTARAGPRSGNFRAIKHV